MLGAWMADLVIAGVQTDRGEIWAAIDAASLEITRLDSLDLTRPVARIRAAGAAVTSWRSRGLAAAASKTLRSTA